MLDLFFSKARTVIFSKSKCNRVSYCKFCIRNPKNNKIELTEILFQEKISANRKYQMNLQNRIHNKNVSKYLTKR